MNIKYSENINKNSVNIVCDTAWQFSVIKGRFLVDHGGLYILLCKTDDFVVSSTATTRALYTIIKN